MCQGLSQLLILGDGHLIFNSKFLYLVDIQIPTNWLDEHPRIPSEQMGEKRPQDGEITWTQVFSSTWREVENPLSTNYKLVVWGPVVWISGIPL